MAKYETTVKDDLDNLKDYIMENDQHFGSSVIRGDEIEGCFGEIWYWGTSYGRPSEQVDNTSDDGSGSMLYMGVMLMQQDTGISNEIPVFFFAHVLYRAKINKYNKIFKIIIFYLDR